MGNVHATDSDSTERAEPRATRAAVTKAHDTLDKLAERAAGAETSAREAASATGEKLGEKRREAEATVDNAISQVNSYVQKNPLASAGIAFAAGALLTTLISRKS